MLFKYYFKFFYDLPKCFVADTFCLLIRFVHKYVLSADTFCRQYVKLPIRFVADTFCSRYILLPIRFVVDTFCPPIRFVADTFCSRYVLG